MFVIKLPSFMDVDSFINPKVVKYSVSPLLWHRERERAKHMGAWAQRV